MKQVTIYCDGGCFPNPGRAAWAALLLEVMQQGVNMYVEDDTYDDLRVDPLRLVGIYGRGAVASADVWPVVARKLEYPCGIQHGFMLENPITEAVRYWYQTIGSLYDVHFWTTEQIINWLRELGL